MAKLDLSYNIVNYTPAAATPVDANFQHIEQHINQELIERDGTVAMRAQLKLVGDPVNELDAAPKQYVDQVLPVGLILMYGGTGTPPGGRWAVCNGAEMQTAQWPELYGIIGHNFSPAGTPGSRFNLPNFSDRMPVGPGVYTTIGQVGGSRNTPVITHIHSHTHDHGTINTTSNGGHDHDFQLRASPGSSSLQPAMGAGTMTETSTADTPSHYHQVNLPSVTKSTDAPAGAVAGTHMNMPPYLGIQYVIRVK